MIVCDFDEYHIQLDVANTCNIMSYAFMLMIHDNGITTIKNQTVSNSNDFLEANADLQYFFSLNLKEHLVFRTRIWCT